MIPLQSIQFARPITTADWGGDKARLRVTAEQADIGLDLDTRLAVLTPKKGTRVTVPLENVIQWQPLPQTSKPSPQTRSAGTSKATAQRSSS